MARNIDYHFKCINPADYELVFTMSADKKLFKAIFNASVLKLKKDKNLDIEEHDVNKFEVHKNFLNLISTSMKKSVRDVIKQLKQDSIIVVTSKINSCNFVKNKKGDWDITIEYIGTYSDER